MGRRRQRAKQRSKDLPSHDSSKRVARQNHSTARKRQVTPRRWLSGLGDRRPVLRFVVIFGVLMGVFYALTVTPFSQERVWPWYLELNAEVSGAVLTFLGEDARVTGRSIVSPRASLAIEPGCDAIHPAALFVSAVLAFPTSAWKKLLAAGVGTVLLMIINVVRIVSLFYVQIHFPRVFEIMHVEVWQALFIFLALLFWVLWAWWATQARMVRAHVAA